MQTGILILLLSFGSQDSILRSTEIITSEYDIRENLMIIEYKEMVYYDSLNQKVSHIIFGVDGSKRTATKFDYNDYNQLIYRKEVTYPSGFFTLTSFKYLSPKFKTPSEIKQVNSKGELVYLMRNEFYFDELVSKEIWLSVEDTSQISSCTEYFYDQNELIVKKLSYEDGKLSSSQVFEYEDGKILMIYEKVSAGFNVVTDVQYMGEEIIHTKSMSKMSGKLPIERLIYNKQNHLLQEIGFDLNGNQNSKVIYDYDDNYNLLSIKWFENSKLKREKIYSREG